MSGDWSPGMPLYEDPRSLERLVSQQPVSVTVRPIFQVLPDAEADRLLFAHWWCPTCLVGWNSPGRCWICGGDGQW